MPRVTVTLPAPLLARLDAAAKREGLSRSAALAQAAGRRCDEGAAIHIRIGHMSPETVQQIGNQMRDMVAGLAGAPPVSAAALEREVRAVAARVHPLLDVRLDPVAGGDSTVLRFTISGPADVVAMLDAPRG